jgi:hypothetical protein
MLRDNGTAMLNVVPNPAVSADEAFLRAVQQAAAADFTVLGEIGRGTDGVIMYLARDTQSNLLVALRLQREGHLANEFTLELARQLDNSMPAPESKCFKCSHAISGWARFCSYCGADLSGADATGGDGSDAMLDAVRQAVAGDYDVLGQMSRTEGGGAVYFARDRNTKRIVALRLQRDGDGEEFSVGLTSALKPLAASLGVKPLATQMLSPVAPLPPPGPRPSVSPIDARPTASGPVVPPSPPPARGAIWAMTRRSKLLLAAGVATLLVLIIVIATLPSSAPSGALTVPPADSAPIATPPPVAANPPAPPPPAPAAVTPPPIAPPPPAAAMHLSTVLIRGLPANAVVHVDGQQHSARRLELRPGTHVLAVQVDGYLPREDTLDLRSGETREWSPSLTAVPAKVVAHAAPPPPSHADAAGRSTANAAQCDQDVASKSWTQAAETCTAAAVNGNASAQRNLASLYDHGHGVHGNDDDAARWYGKAANGGDREAMYQLAIDYEHGHGVKKDETAAAQWYAHAADAGHPLAQYALGEAYEKGHLGLNKDKAKALDWYRKAAAQGNKDAADKVHDLSR